MSPAERELEIRAADAAARLLRQAAAFVALHAPPVLFKKTMKLHIGNTTKTYLVHVCAPGIVRVYDTKTSELLTESAPGQLDRLGLRFVPTDTR